MALEEGALHLRNGVVPVGGVLLEERLVAEQASDPSPQDHARPIPHRSSERHPRRCRGVGISTVLDLEFATSVRCAKAMGGEG